MPELRHPPVTRHDQHGNRVSYRAAERTYRSLTVSGLCFWHSLCVVFQEDSTTAVNSFSCEGWFMSARTRLHSINPATEEVGATFDLSSPEDVEQALTKATGAYRQWRHIPFAKRARLLRTAAACWREQHSRLAQLLSAARGKPSGEAEAEVAKGAGACEFYADQAQYCLCDRSSPSCASESSVQLTPLGTVLALRPWNYPLWHLLCTTLEVMFTERRSSL